MADLPIDAIILEDNDRGTLWQNNGNETIQDSKFSDASKFRVGSPYEKGQSGGGGALSFDIIGGMPPRKDGTAPPTRVEVVGIGGAVTQQGGGELGIWVTKPGTWSDIDDAAQQKVAEFRGDQIEFKVPISAPNLSGSDGGGKRVYHEGGKFVTIYQDDGHVVTYDMRKDPWKALWGNWEGNIVPPPWV